MKKYLFLFALSLLAACSEPTDNTVPLQYDKNVSTVFGNGGPIKDSLGFKTASNIIWRDSVGDTVSIKSLKGNIIVLNFWATWCGYCVAEIPDLLSIQDEFKNDGVKVIGVAIDRDGEPLKAVKDYANKKKMTYQIVLDQFAKSYVNYGGNGTIPWTFVINKDGTIYKKIIGQTTKAELERVINEIL